MIPDCFNAFVKNRVEKKRKKAIIAARIFELFVQYCIEKALDGNIVEIPYSRPKGTWRIYVENYKPDKRERSFLKGKKLDQLDGTRYRLKIENPTGKRYDLILRRELYKKFIDSTEKINYLQVYDKTIF